MPAPNLCYKVVQLDGKKLVSAVANHIHHPIPGKLYYTTEYKVGEWAEGKDFTPLFVFSKRLEAEAFASRELRGLGGYVYLAEYDDRYPVQDMMSHSIDISRRWLKTFWKNLVEDDNYAYNLYDSKAMRLGREREHVYPRATPPETILVYRVKLIEPVYEVSRDSFFSGLRGKSLKDYQYD